MKTFIRVVESWVPSAESGMLEFAGGLFGEARRFEAATQGLGFGRGEGLPGQVWETGRPIVLRDLENSYFRRAAAARAEGITCGIALPVFKGDALASVIVIFCGDDEAHAGAIELWCNDPEQGVDMNLVDGYYGSTGDTFEFISRSTSFRRGTGLPGATWERGGPVLMPDLGKGSGFLRSDGAQKVGINRGFAWPCSTIDGTTYVLAFLSALATPVARQVELWEPQGPGGALMQRLSFREPEGVLDLDHGRAAPDAVQQAHDTGVPGFIRPDGASAAAPGVAIPIAPGGRPGAVVVLTL